MRCDICGYRLIGNEEEGYKHIDKLGRIINQHHMPDPVRDTHQVRDYWNQEKEGK